jgi:DNA invertase Pin-like site-specific DNA recombinase
MPKRAAIYCRISKDVEGSGLGVDRQERECRALADREGLDVVETFTDNDLSAYRGKRRPRYAALVEALRARTVDTVIVWHPDRLTRSTRELEDLVDLLDTTRARVVTVVGGEYDLATAAGRMTARVVGAVARHESEHRSERLRSKADDLARRGRPPGGRTPYGFLPGYSGHDRVEAKALRYMARRVLEGASLLAVARELDAKGIPTKEGRAWHHSTVRAVLLNPAVTGLRVHRRQVAGPAAWEPIIDRATWEQVRAVLADPARKRRRPPRRNLLVGMVQNPNGDPMNGRPEKGGRAAYATRPPARPSLSIDAERLETYVVDAVLSVLHDADIPDETPDELPTAADIAAVEAELADLARLRGEGVVTLGEWLAAREPLQRRLDDARRAAGGRARPSPVAPLLARPGGVQRAWPNLDLVLRREIVAAIVEAVVVGPAIRGRWTRIADRVEIRWRA